MTNYKNFSMYIVLCIVLSMGCEEKQTMTNLQIERTYGSWILAEAVRDGRLTKTLDGAILELDSTTFTTNIFGEKEDYIYERKGFELLVKAKANQVFKIDKVSLDTLILGMNRKRKRYQLLFVKRPAITTDDLN